MELKKDDTQMIQGLSVLAMLMLHLFCRYNYEELYTPLLFLGELPFVFGLAQLSDFCVMGFAFCSGYAQYILWKKEGSSYFKGRIKSLLYLYCNFWVICIAFSIISILVGKEQVMPGTFGEIIKNFSSLDVTYNGAWWYLFIYAIITVISPIVLRLIKKNKSFVVLTAGFILYCAAYYVRFYTPGHGWLLEKFGTLGMTIFEYVLGVLFCKEHIFTWLKKYIDNVPKLLRVLLAGGSILAMFVFRMFIVRSLFVAPITGLVIIIIFVFWNKPNFIRKLFLFMGEHSTNMWLTHMFFYSGIFVNLVFGAKYPAFIFLFMILLCLLASFIVNLAYKPLKRLLQKKLQFGRAL